MIKLGYFLFRELTFRDKIDLAKKLNLDAVQPGNKDVTGDADVHQMAAIAKEANITIDSLCVPVHTCRPSGKADSLNTLKALIEKAKILGVKLIICSANNPDPGIGQKDAWNYTVDFYRLYCDLCGENGMKFVHETDHGCFVQNLERTEWLFEKVNHKNLYLNYDPANFYIGGSDPLKVIDRMKQYIVSGHIKDAVYLTDNIGETKIGEGELDYPGILKKMEKENLSITMYLEHCKNAQDVIDGANCIRTVLN